MFQNFNIVAAACATAILVLSGFGNLHGQSDPIGPFSFVNAIDSTKPTMVYIDGDAYKPKGYASGQMTYGGRVYAGSKSIKVTNEEFGEATIPVTIGPGVSTIILAYVKVTKKPDDTLERKLDVLTFPSRPSKTYRYSAIYASNVGQAELIVNDQPILLAPMKAVEVAQKARVMVSTGLGETFDYSPEVPGHYIIFAYDRADSSKAFCVFDDIPDE